MDDSDDDVPLHKLKSPKKEKKKNRLSEESTNQKKKKPKVKPDPAPSSSASKKKDVVNKKRKASGASEAPASKKPKTLKKLEKSERLQFAMQSFLWWNAEDPPEGCQWRTMEHAGVSFPPPYQPHGIKMKYDGKQVDLTPEQEEA
jgi:DNA topoisomerase-1